MKKTNTKKSTSTKKAPVAAKAVTPVVTETTKKKVAIKKSAPKKTSPAKTTAKKTVVPKKTPEVKKPAQKKVAIKKSAPTAPKEETKITPHVAEKVQKEDSHEDVKMLGIFHFVANIISGGTLGIIVVLAYFLWKKSELSHIEKATCYEVLNFNISFLLYTLVLAVSVVGIFLIPFLALIYLVLLILGFVNHLKGKNYQYPLVIRFLP